MTLKKLTIAAVAGASLAVAGAVMTQAQNQPPSAPPAPQVQPVQKVIIPQEAIDQDAAAVLRQSAQATAALHSLSADVEADSVVPVVPWGPVASLTLKRPAQVLSESPGVNGQSSFVNGKDFWFYTHWNRQYQREAGLDLSTGNIGPPVFSTFFFNPGLQGLIFSGLTDPAQRTRTRLLGTRPWHGSTYTALQINRPARQGDGELSMVGTFTVYFGLDHLLHGFAVDIVYRGKRTVEEYALKNIRLNPDVPDAKFIFVPPAGARPTQPPVADLH